MKPFLGDVELDLNCILKALSDDSVSQRESQERLTCPKVTNLTSGCSSPTDEGAGVWRDSSGDDPSSQNRKAGDDPCGKEDHS